MNNLKLRKKLTNIGLTDKQASVYTALFELGGAYPSKIAEITKINRSTVYKILLELSVKGLVNEIEKKNKLFYQVEDPGKLIKFSKEQLKITESQLEKAQSLVPELRELFSNLGDKPRVLFFEGPETMENLLNDMVNTDKKYEMVAFSNAEMFKDFMSVEYMREFVKKKEKIGITSRGIIPDTQEDKEYFADVYKNIDKKIVPVTRFVDPKNFNFQAEITMYGKNKVSIAKLSKESLIGIMIEDQTIHDMMKMIFELSWTNAKE